MSGKVNIEGSSHLAFEMWASRSPTPSGIRTLHNLCKLQSGKSQAFATTPQETEARCRLSHGGRMDEESQAWPKPTSQKRDVGHPQHPWGKDVETCATRRFPS